MRFLTIVLFPLALGCAHTPAPAVPTPDWVAAPASQKEMGALNRRVWELSDELKQQKERHSYPCGQVAEGHADLLHVQLKDAAVQGVHLQNEVLVLEGVSFRISELCR